MGILSQSHAQVTPSLKQFDLKIDKEHKRIIIPFKLSDQSDYRYDYDIKFFVTQDQGKVYTQLRDLKGYYGDNIIAIDSLGNYEAWWMYQNDDPEFDGKHMKVKIKVDYKPSVFNFKNEPAMIYSVLLPGLGQTKVRRLAGWKKNRWIGTAVLVYGAIGGSILMKKQSDDLYNNYKEADRRADAQSLYNDASQKKKIAMGLAVVAGAIWATDIILVGLRGRHNRITKKKILEHHEEVRKELSLSIDPTSANYGYSPTPMLTFRIKF